MPHSSKEGKLCYSCGCAVKRVLVCDQCFLYGYCSQRCYELDWPRHAEDCKFLSCLRRKVGKEFCAWCYRKHHSSSSDCVREIQWKLCGGCLEVSYCSQKCQKLDWSYHRVVCKNMARKPGRLILL